MLSIYFKKLTAIGYCAYYWGRSEYHLSGGILFYNTESRNCGKLEILSQTLKNVGGLHPFGFCGYEEH